MIKKGTYKPPIDSVYEFDQYKEAIDRLMSNRAKGKVFLYYLMGITRPTCHEVKEKLITIFLNRI
ncbi:CLL_collapsed_G0042260.mRNA.1.CDS.1 [Saccharomyces cerevisiae]|nr:CLL_HP2_G0036540.mRNA.1.CDS.1 [Saccharomyces cerevisiae]CAI6559247.1 CLL_HP2_G0036540.mRNA.1.CDS.1 [Saccharomyces cerevisiae]CAI6662224.1 CLL_HP1_G0041720.mRNA.1.CDS.1 [Saccharomyces cerevisiae]CAI7430652.1 CLL_collapsed_G0042260.mRNA.1.CDS.1 [Saccharomyces cerevisiae]